MQNLLQSFTKRREGEPRQCGLVLRDDCIIETIARLQQRIIERFPGSGLGKLCGELLNIARQASERSSRIGRPIFSIRFVGYALAIASVILLLWFVGFWAASHDIEDEVQKLTDLITTAEAGANVLLLFAAAIYFLVSFETRIKRRRALTAIHELRSICHIIDMHQLTKDPERILKNWESTTNSPRQQMTPLELNRYLDYCSEMLSLTGKIAALYVRDFDDTESVASVSDVEQLSTGLSRKIWQKIMILEQQTAVSHTPIPSDSPADVTPDPLPPMNEQSEEHQV
ncbi:hypothetical protein [Rhodopirellula sallentina]|uniref:Putative membrane protein n=1 Tax=Rhodopirellula sallentina SM41 TaxID=1263870 RepID=M5UMI9_9BACT|nr:hypothetical protein [Rhodopirellula sallentina]EMI57203.1 putative membrane protein [Rhodopirellula sallentina SM41]